MASFTSAGLADLHGFIASDWQYIEVRDDSAAGTGGAPIVRLNVSDPRVTVTDNGTNVVVQVVLTGSDADVTTPVTARSTAIYDVASGGTARSEEVHVEGDATLSADVDSVTVSHTLTVS